MATTEGAEQGVTSVRPYWDLTFDADGDPDPGQRDALLSGARDLTDLVLFSHGWNNDLSTANALYDRFFAPFPGLLPDAATGLFGYAGVHWPSMRFSDEPIPDFPHTPAGPARGVRGAVGGTGRVADGGTGSVADRGTGSGGAGSGGEPAPGGPGLDAATRTALLRVFPAGRQEVHRIAELLASRPQQPQAVAEFVTLVGRLTGGATAATGARGAEDLLSLPASASPGLLAGDPVAVCAQWARVAADAAGAAGVPGGDWPTARRCSAVSAPGCGTARRKCCGRRRTGRCAAARARSARRASGRCWARWRRARRAYGCT